VNSVKLIETASNVWVVYCLIDDLILIQITF